MKPIERSETEARHNAKFQKRKPAYETQIAAIKARLERGTHWSWSSWRPLTESHRQRLEWNLRVLEFRLENQHQGRWSNELPDPLRFTNPQGSQRSR